MGSSIGWQTESTITFTEFTFLNVLAYWSYFASLEGTLGATFGKIFVRLGIYDADGSKLSIGKAFVRFPLKVVSIASVIGVFMIDINRNKQGLHDLICGTIVRRS